MNEGFFDSIKAKMQIAKTSVIPAEARLQKILTHIMTKLIPEVTKTFNVSSNFKVTYKLDATSDDVSSNASFSGPIFVSIGVKRFIEMSNKSEKNPAKANCLYAIVADHQEYPAFASDSEIGSLNKLSIENLLLVECLHEMAHTIQQYYLYSKDQVDESVISVVKIIIDELTSLRKLNTKTMSKSFLSDYIIGSIKNNKDYDQKSATPEQIQSIILKIRDEFTSIPDTKKVIEIVKSSNIFDIKPVDVDIELQKSLIRLGYDINTPESEMIEHGKFFQFIYRIVRKPYNQRLATNQQFIIESVSQKIITFDEFLIEAEAANMKRKTKLKFSDTGFKKGKIQIDLELIKSVQDTLK